MVFNARCCLPLELRLHLISPTSFCLGCCFSKGLIECCVSSLALCLHDEVHVKFERPKARLIYSFERYGATPLGSEYAVRLGSDHGTLPQECRHQGQLKGSGRIGIGTNYLRSSNEDAGQIVDRSKIQGDWMTNLHAVDTKERLRGEAVLQVLRPSVSR
ncbi:hypothetical protein VNO77_02890 [Canavalia gladiata]|uniref:Uncharacterized protein n=1 Tax=Canavalia gladiata TaxID=3824 RepID=A0AAN9RBP9_CANGL